MVAVCISNEKVKDGQVNVVQEALLIGGLLHRETVVRVILPFGFGVLLVRPLPWIAQLLEFVVHRQHQYNRSFETIIIIGTNGVILVAVVAFSVEAFLSLVALSLIDEGTKQSLTGRLLDLRGHVHHTRGNYRRESKSENSR